MYLQVHSSCVTFFFPKMITLCWDWGRSRNPTLCSLCAHTKSACAHAACKHNMPFLESEFEFLDAKAISVLPAHGLPMVSGSHRWHTFGRTPSAALLWLQGCREHLEVPSLAESCKAGDPLALFLMGADSFTCCLDADTLEIPTELVFRPHRCCESHLTSLPYPGDFHQALAERRIYYD